jgi:hypothetical protein
VSYHQKETPNIQDRIWLEILVVLDVTRLEKLILSLQIVELLALVFRLGGIELFEKLLLMLMQFLELLSGTTMVALSNVSNVWAVDDDTAPTFK